MTFGSIGAGDTSQATQARCKSPGVMRRLLLGSTAAIGLATTLPAAAQSVFANGTITVSAPTVASDDQSDFGGGVDILAGGGTVTFNSANIFNTIGTGNAVSISNLDSSPLNINFVGTSSNFITLFPGGAAVRVQQNAGPLTITHTVGANYFQGSYGERYITSGTLTYGSVNDAGGNMFDGNGSGIAGIALTGSDIIATIVSPFIYNTGAGITTNASNATTLSVAGGNIAGTMVATGISATGGAGATHISSGASISANSGIVASGSGLVSITTTNTGNINGLGAGGNIGILATAFGTGSTSVSVNAAIGDQTAFAMGVRQASGSAPGVTNRFSNTAAITAATASANNYGVAITGGDATTLGLIDVGANITGGSGIHTQGGAFAVTVRQGATLTAAASGGIGLYSDTPRTTITNAGVIQAIGSGGTAVKIDGAESITNSGSITAASGAAIALSSTNQIDLHSITNSGTITGGADVTSGYAIAAYDGRLSLTNHSGGTISAQGSNPTGRAILLASDDVATLLLSAGSTVTGTIESNNSGTRSITSGGSITGGYNASNGSGADSFTLVNGSVTGNILLGGGNDSFTYTGGSYGGLVDGGSGSNNFVTQFDAAASNTVALGNVTNFANFDHNSGSVTYSGAGGGNATFNAGNGGSNGTVIFNGTTALTGSINVNGAIVRAATVGAFGFATINMIDPTVQFGATGTYANTINLQAVNPASDPSRLEVDNGVTATLTGVISEATGGPSQPLTFGLTSGSTTGSFSLTNIGNNWTGTTTIDNGVTLTGTSQVISGSNIVINGTLVLNLAANETNPRVISGSGRLQKSGPATLFLSGFNSYTGTTQIVFGTLALSGAGSIAASSSIINNGIFDVSGAFLPVHVNNLIGNGLIYLGSTTLTADYTANGTISGNISGTGSFIKTGNGTLIVSGINSYSGGTNVESGTMVARNTANGFGSGALTIAAGATAEIQKQTTGMLFMRGGTISGNGTLRLSADDAGGVIAFGNNGGMVKVALGQGGVIDVQGPGLVLGSIGYQANWSTNRASLNIGAGASFDGADANIIIDALTGSGLYRGGYYGSGSTVIGIANGSGDFSGILADSLSGASILTLTKVGTGTQTLGGVNSYTGSTLITAGTLALVGNASIAGSSSVTNQATFDIAAAAGNVTVNQLSGSGNIVLGANSLTANNALTGMISGNITGTGGFTKSGAGILTLSGVNSYTGITSVNGGMLTGTTNSLSGSVIAISNGAILSYNQAFAGTVTQNITGAGHVIMTNSGLVTFLGDVSNGGDMNALGTGSQIGISGTRSGGNLAAISLDGLNSGLTVNTSGSVQGSANVGVITNQTATITNLGAISGDVAAIQANASLAIINSGSITSQLGDAIYADGAITLISDGVIGGSISAIHATGLYADSVTLGAMSVTSGDLRLDGGDDTLTLFAGAVIHGTLSAGTGSDALILDGSDSGTLANGLSGFESLTKNGSGNFTLDATGDGFANLTVNDGTLNIARAQTIQGTAATIASGATLGILVDTALSTLTGAGNVVLAGTTLTLGSDNTDFTFGGVMSGTGSLTKTGTGTLTLTGANLYTGVTEIQAGTLQLGADNVLSDSTYLRVQAGATLDLNGFSDTVGSFDLLGTLTGGGILTANAYNLYGGTLDMALGGGTVNQMSGTTRVNGTIDAGTIALLGGSLQLGTDNRLSDSTAVSVSSGASLDLGSYSDSVASLDLSGSLNGTGTLTAATYTLSNAVVNGNLGSGALTQQAGTSLLNGTAAAELVNVAGGTLTLGAADRLNDAAALTIASGAILDLGSYTDGVASVALAGSLNGTGTLTATNYALNGATVNANLGAGTLTQNTGTSMLNGRSAVQLVNVAGGTLTLGASDRLDDATTLNIASGATLNLGGFGDTVQSAVIAGQLNGSGTLTATSYTLNGGVVNANLGAGTLTQASGSSTLNGHAAATALRLTAGTLTLGDANLLNPAAVVTLDSGSLLNLGSHSQTVSGLAGAGRIALSGATLTLTQNSNGWFDGSISGTGGLVKSGSGTLNLTGANSFTGNTLVTDGLLSVNGSLASSVILRGNGRLGGNGSVGSVTVGAGAVIAPGNSIGLLKIAGNLTIEAGAFYAVETTPTAADKIEVTGVTTLQGGTVQVLADGTAYSPLTRYTILQSDGGVNGRFSTVTSNLAFLTPVLEYDTNLVTLILRRNDVTFADVAQTPNQQAVANAVQQQGVGSALNDALLVQSAESARSGYDALSGAIYATVSSTIIAQSHAPRRALLHAGKNAADGLGIWGMITTGGGSFDGNATAGLAKYTGDMSGYLTGVSFARNGFHATLAAGQANSDGRMHSQISSDSIATNYLGGDIGYRLGGLSVQAGILWGWHDIDIRRQVSFPGFSESETSQRDGTTRQYFGDVAFALIDGPALRVAPFVGYTRLQQRLDGDAERGGVAALTIGRTRRAINYLDLGLRLQANRRLGSATVSPVATLAWECAWGDRDATTMAAFGNGTPFAISGVGIARNALQLSTGLNVELRNISFGFGYEGSLARHQSQHAAKANIAIRF